MNTDIGDARYQDRLCSEAQPAGAGGPEASGPIAWLLRRPQLILTLLTVAALVPFSAKAFHIDDPIFLWTAQQIAHHPLDFYGFTATWWSRATPMWQIQQNPPLAAYYMAMIGSIAGWSERALHLGFLLPAVIVVLGTYRLARRMTRHAFLAAAATLVAPGFLVSATGLMCDVSMLALWLLAVLCWMEGLDGDGPRPAYLAISGILIAACALTKYFGVSLIPLLFAYSCYRRRSLRGWIGYLAIPVVILAGYEFYTHQLYGHGLIRDAVLHKSVLREREALSGRALVGLAFAGGCVLPVLAFVPLLWSRRQMLWGALAAALLALAFWRGWIGMGSVYEYARWLQAHPFWLAEHMFFYIAGAISLLALAMVDFRRSRDAVSLLLLLWVLGTMFFSIVVNWDVNARSILPMVPAVGILIARRLERKTTASGSRRWLLWSAPLIVCGAISVWVAAGDMALAATARLAAEDIRTQTQGESNAVWFEGRWGFAYYMELFGARPVEPDAGECRPGDLVVIPKYNTALFKFPLQTTRAKIADYNVPTWITAMNPDAGAGFYFSGWGPLPFVLGRVPPHRYLMARVLQGRE
ncbi:MAG TPA: glycosyltransferase family 39 protein [Terriglobales bacterium]|nr:glycosyltransferase family 39 protein [Terriglobales bacterium]